MFEEAGLPPGVLQMMPGGADVGEAIVTHPLVRVISFTGSTPAGRRVGALAGQHLKRAHLELGGNSALIVLEAQIATNYRRFHESLEAAGMLAGMPEPMKCAVLRGFQTHDFQHVVTGYDASGQGEIALQAFCLAQLQFPYFGIWMSVITTRATFVDPRMIVPMMDAVADGWQLGRRVVNIQAERWEDHLDEPLERIRARYGMNPSALAERLAARRSGFKRQTAGRALS